MFNSLADHLRQKKCLVKPGKSSGGLPSVCLITTSFPVTEGSASGPFVERLAAHLNKHVALEVVTPAPHVDERRLEYPFPVYVQRYAPARWQVLAHAPGGIPVALARHRLAWLALPLLLATLFCAGWRAAGRANVVHANWSVVGVVAGAAARLRGRPVITTLRGEDVNRARTSWLFRALLRGCLRMSSRVAVVGPSVASALRHSAPGSAGKVVVIPNGVAPGLLSLTPPVSGMGRRLRLLFVGSLIPRKGVDVLLRACTALPGEAEWSLRLVGDGPELEGLRHEVNEQRLDERVTFVGSVNADAVANELAQADVLVLPSYREGRPNAVIEAMAAARAVVVSDIPGNRELVGENQERGLYFPPGDIDGLAAQLRRLLEAPSLVHTLGASARDWVSAEGLTWESAAERYAQVYKQLLHGRGA